jgi:hypothetical protein
MFNLYCMRTCTTRLWWPGFNSGLRVLQVVKATHSHPDCAVSNPWLMDSKGWIKYGNKTTSTVIRQCITCLVPFHACCLVSCTSHWVMLQVENYLMLSEFENNLIAEMPVILDRKGRRWSLARWASSSWLTPVWLFCFPSVAFMFMYCT